MGTQGNRSSFSFFSTPLLGRVHRGDCDLRMEEGMRENSIRGEKPYTVTIYLFKGERKPVFKNCQCQRHICFSEL